MATRLAFIIMFFALPGWMLKPLTSHFADAALKVS